MIPVLIYTAIKVQVIIVKKNETKGYVERRRSIKLLSSMIPNINKFVSTIIDAGYDNQKIVGSNDLKLLPIKDSCCWNMYICCNAQTKEFHSENDVGYTLISVPNQNIPSFKKTPTFLFKLNERKDIGLELTNEISFLYSGLFLEHRQAMTSDQDKKIPFYNVSSYSNRKLFNHLKKSLHRYNDNVE